MAVVGTAGHVDHGKSTLVLRLTGRDPDRWEEEKARGLTIDLGFAWTDLPSGEEVSFVDVPGHERFIKNMLAGIEAIDVALLVVAADEGWMPGTEEHLAVLDLLEVRRGVVAVTKVDRVDAETVELARLEIEEHLTGTGLADAPIVAVSATTGEGIDALIGELDAAIAALPPDPAGTPRMWIDRAFTVAGAGTVVTGTLLDGALHLGDEVELWPGPLQARIRSLHSHERALEVARPRRRVAANVAGVAGDVITRGWMLGEPGGWVPSDRIVVDIRRARYMEEPLPDRGAYHLHLGSGAWPVRLRTIVEDDDRQVALLTLPTPLPVRMGDRFVLREVGRRAVVGGGRVLEPRPRRRPTQLRTFVPALRRSLGAPAGDRADALLEARGIEDAAVLRAHAGAEPRTGTRLGDRLLSPAERERVEERMAELLAAFHTGHPLRPGMSKAELSSALALELRELDDLLTVTDRATVVEGTVAATGFSTRLSDADERLWKVIEEALRAGGPAPPRRAELRAIGLDDELYHALLRAGRLVAVSDDLVYLPDELDRIVTITRRLPDPFGVPTFKEAIGVSRKYAMPLLAWLDRTGVTRREGDVRRILRAPDVDGEGSAAT